MRILISSDSTCDLSKSYVEEHNISILPLCVIKDGQSYRDGVDIIPQDIFSHVAAGGSMCTTAANNVDDYLTHFREMRKEYDAIIHINISAEFSSCYQNACIAAEEVENVYVVDSRNLSTGHGLVVCEAVKLVEEGKLSPAEIAENLRELTSRVEASFILDQLEYLRKGGRCSALAALGANLLKLKPCIEVKDGKMGVGKKYRGKFDKCVLEYIKERLDNRDDLSYDRIFITMTTLPEQLKKDIRALVETYPFEIIDETTAGCTVSCHCGPDTIGVLFVRSK